MNTKPQSFQILTRALNDIREKGFVPCTRPNNKDGGIGNTLEDLLEVVENNRQECDYLDYEIKSQRELSSSAITLFSMASKHIEDAKIRNNRRLFENYSRQDMEDNVKRLYWTIIYNRESLLYENYKCSLRFDDELNPTKLFLVIIDMRNNYIDNLTYWDLNVIRNKISGKMKNLLACTAIEKNINGVRYFNYNSFECYFDFNFSNFINAIKDGVIQVDFRIGADLTGNNAGKYHDHGTGFRIQRRNLKDLYETYESI
jgi:hypothetical protein